jgi:hypothetical protein
MADHDEDLRRAHEPLITMPERAAAETPEQQEGTPAPVTMTPAFEPPAAAAPPAAPSPPTDTSAPPAAAAPPAAGAAGDPTAIRDANQTYTIASGDTLYRIAGNLYNKPNLWQSIYNNNRDLIRNPHRISPNTQLNVPSLASIIDTATNGNQVLWAFEAYWNVSSSRVDGARRWDPDVIRHIHQQMRALPDQDTRNGVWQGLQLTNDENLRDRAAWDGSNFIVGQNAETTAVVPMGHGTRLAQDAASGDSTIQVDEPARFAVDETVAVDRHSADNKDTGKITQITDATYTLDTPLGHAHNAGTLVTPDDDTGTRGVNWLAATVRHEIAHAVETALGGVTGFTQGIGGWWTGAEFDTWAGAMADPWGASQGITLTEDEKSQIKQAIVDAVASAELGGLDITTTVDPTHPLITHWADNIPVVVAANACLSAGDGFTGNANAIYASNGKRFSVSSWYKQFMYHNENVVSQRVSDYSLYAPAEFFAETYTVFYEEAGQPGVTEDQYGRLVRNSTWRTWMKDNIHNRGMAPSAPDSSTGSGTAPAQGAAVGKHAGNPGR